MSEQSNHERLKDRFEQVITDLRLSVTDRCNFRCLYCRSGESGLPSRELGREDLRKLVRSLASLGIEKVRITGGEPLLRGDIFELLQDFRSIPLAFANQGQSFLELALTTNGHLLAKSALRLKRAGLTRITVSLDAVTQNTFESIVRVPGAFSRVLDGIHAAQDAGFASIKVNCVLMRGINDHQIESLGEFARKERVILRFIEFMPLDDGRSWSSDAVIEEAEVLNRLSAIAPLRMLPATQPSETARRYAFTDGVGEIGIIAPVSRPFCGQCSRIRITADAKLRTCLFSREDHDISPLLQGDASHDQLRSFFRRVILTKEARHRIGEPDFVQPSRGMVQIGG